MFTRRDRTRRYYPAWFLAPALIIFTLFYILPAVFGLGLSLTDARLTSSTMNFVGLANYEVLFSAGGQFVPAVINQFVFALLVTLGKTGIGVALALFMDQRFAGRDFLRALVYAPIMISLVIVGMVFNFLLASDGFVNGLLRSVGLDGITRAWLGDFDTALVTVAAVDVWVGVGWTLVIVLAALQGVPHDVLEASRIDGAGPGRTIFAIKLPLIAHAINLALLLTFISGMKAFDIIYATTGGGPGHATEVISTFIAKQMVTGSLAVPAAASFAQFVLITALALVINIIIRRREAAAE
ncbi:sugar ABC transporter permease [Tessaracoccus sp. MC1865]|uniref:carbohydrate ABC transporter permease n=1 Tax=Tessaracoccus sp. MC1865 TaxID=2760310 RepID=UPI00160303C7|nr:sugar ABC transporter permease [Tessaracoccus sp. MC1865]MBB1482384.1 sugar ABC transporter permease [Tessaracoccus sp. MC1865]QTO38152.1 sugar ABC transporter permease [Tessaracoccus sp. MC1865]